MLVFSQSNTGRKAITVARRSSKASRSDTRRQSREQQALQTGINGDKTVREAADKAHMPKSTLQNRINRIESGCGVKKGRVGRALDLQKEEEDLLVKWLQKIGDTGYPLTRLDLVDVVEELVGLMWERRREKLRLEGGRPRKDWVTGFQQCHKGRVRFGRASKQEAARIRATNADTLTTHMVSWEEFCRRRNLEATLIFNTDENEMTPGKDVDRTTTKRTCTTAGVRGQHSQPLFKNYDR